ncbi:uncharacterized protein LOC132718693 [Ruditapes philippinarum]|uniref:uncharacterized protein LOC132718693 n=1 Tax=Ruditapes philippinarum TaxID=129788 RepID=UPI00295BC140|nr:uncharacterized protein LOC132718693 [Ruditapes philippinarum]
MFYQMITLCVILMIMTCYSQKTDDITRDRKSPCSNSKCGKYSYRKILKMFPGTFYTRKQIEGNERQFRVARMKYLVEQGIHMKSGMIGDGDSCCPTKTLTFTNFTMTNIDGENKYLVHTPPKYQFIPHGVCMKGGTCDGICVNEPVTHSLLTYNVEKGKLEFDLFIVPGYCSCKSV